MIEPTALFAQYQDLQRYVGWTFEDAQRVESALPLVRESFPELIDDFYREINDHTETQTVITGGEEQVARLKRALLTWIEQLFCGTYDAQFVSCRWNAGYRHVEIGVNQIYASIALSRLRNNLIQLLAARWIGEERELASTIRSLNKLLDLDLVIIEDAYRAEYFQRQQQTERLATIGLMAAGVAHELRNPLNIIKTSVYFLLHANAPGREKVVQHLMRIDRQVDAADRITKTLTDFARLSSPIIEPFPLAACLQETLEICSLPGNICVTIDVPDAFPDILADRGQMQIVFGNLIRNAHDAMPEGGQLTLVASQKGMVAEIAVADNGEGIPQDHLERILEPLYSTKTAGIGLGLAITCAILQKHNAQIDVCSEIGVGTTFIVTLAVNADEPRI